MPKSKKPTIWDLDLDKHMGCWIIKLNCPDCGQWYSTILSLYHEGSGPAPLVHETNGERHILDVLDLRAKNWCEIEIHAKKRENEEVVVLRGSLNGRFYRAKLDQDGARSEAAST